MVGSRLSCPASSIALGPSHHAPIYHLHRFEHPLSFGPGGTKRLDVDTYTGTVRRLFDFA